MTDSRIDELQALASEEGIELPYPVDVIIRLEDRNYVVDLNTGTLYRNVKAIPASSARAIVHLLSDTEGTISI